MEAAAFVDHYLGLLRDPAAGAALWDLYAEDAPLPWLLDVRRRGLIPRDDFAAVVLGGAYAHMVANGGEPPRPALVGPTILGEQVAGDRTLIWFQADEVVGRHPVVGAVGARRGEDGWKVHWATLAPEVMPWSWEMGLAQAVADTAFLAGGGLETPRGWIDVAYWRMHLMPRPPLEALPEARFRCGASLGCCDIGFRIELAASAQAMVDHLPAEAVPERVLGLILEPTTEGRVLLKAAGERCRFLDERKQCVVHRALGRQPFAVCAGYPLRFARTPDGVAVTTAMTCCTARAGLGPPLLDAADDLYMRLAILPPGPAPEAFRLAPGVEADWPTYRAATQALLDVLGDAARPLPERLAAGTSVLAERVGPAWTVKGPAPHPADLDATFAALARALVPGLPADRPAPSPAAPLADPALVAHVTASLRALLFGHETAFLHDLATAWHVGLVAAAAVAEAAACGALGGAPTPADAMWRLNTLLFHGDPVSVVAREAPTAMPWRELLGHPGFGRAALESPLLR